MDRWGRFASAQPEMAEAGRKLIYQYGIGLGYLATVRPDGGPRLHPFCPILAGEGLYGFIIPSPKRDDLVRDGRFAIHTCGPEDRDDEFYLTGRACAVTSPADREAALASYTASGGKAADDEECFEFLLDTAMLATYKPRAEGNTWPPTYTKWRATEGEGT